MDPKKRKKIEAAGFRVGDATDFLDLTPAEAALVELKLALADGVRRRRAEAHLTQTQLARRIGSSQARMAKVEAAEPGVSTDLMLKAFFATGGTPGDLAEVLGRRPRGGRKAAPKTELKAHKRGGRARSSTPSDT